VFESDFFHSTPNGKAEYQKLIAQAAEVLCESMPTRAYTGKNAAELRRLVSPDILPQTASTAEQIATILRTVVQNSVAINHPNTAAHLHCPPLLAAQAAEVVTNALNQSMDSFDQAPIATVMEQEMIRWMCAEIEFPTTSDGTFTTGGSQSNYMALLLARNTAVQKYWNCSVQESGLPHGARHLRIFCSEVAHVTVEKAASQLGLGTNAVIRVAVDERFRMRPEALRDALEAAHVAGLLPMAVVATAGTTDFGSVDTLPDLTAMARAANAWLHVDAAYGGALLFSKAHRAKLSGIEVADSIGLDFHKLFWQPVPCSALLLRNARHFDSIKLYAPYLNPEGHEAEGIPNLVTNSLLTTRRFDALKLWISFQSLGRAKLSAMIDRTVELAAYSAKIIRSSQRLELVCEPQLSTVVFRYAPSRTGHDSDSFNAILRQRLFDRGLAVIGHTRVHTRQCLKFTCMNPTVTEDQMEQLIQTVVDQGMELEREITRLS